MKRAVRRGVHERPETMQTLLSRHWHHLDVPEVLDLLETDGERGLDLFDIKQRQQRFGTNAITHRRPESPLVLFLRQFHQPLIYILLAAAAVTFAFGAWVDSGVIFGVVLVNAIIGHAQESKARDAILALSRTMAVEATVVRAGVRMHVPAGDLVPGDLVLLAPGDKVPADLRLVRCRELRIDESSLTGESVPVRKHSDAINHDTALAERHDMAYGSTLVTYGTAQGIVVATGDQTEIGCISRMIATADVLSTPLTKRIAGFSRLLLYAILALAVVTMVVGVLRGQPLFEMFMAATALAVGAIPEGLPAALTITLAIGVGRMARRHAVIRRLPAVETLGSTTVICTDKTGTLTQNQMTVTEVVCAGRRYSLDGVGYAPAGGVFHDGRVIAIDHHQHVEELFRAGLLCNDARLRQRDGCWHVEGDPTEGALITAAHKAGIDGENTLRLWPRIDELPFESERQYMATLHNREGHPPVAYVKGSVERLVERCLAIMGPHGPEVLDPEAVHEVANEMASRGLRVLAFARKTLPDDVRTCRHDDIDGGLILLGLQAMIDPPRAEVAESVRACQRAGIMVKMITGDHVRTATAIASAIGLEGAVTATGELHALTGRDLDRLSDDELIEHAHRTAVFARVAPEQKLRLVQALQAPHAHGHVVAMTGDGVNDAPALRRADIGVAMGLSGTEVAKEAADMVLTDDNFRSIEAAVEEGRGVYDNLVKFITWTLPTNLGEGLVILVAILAGLDLPILPVQILWINMTTAVLLGLMLAFERKEPGLMERPPRDPRSPILTVALLQRIVLVGFLLLVGAFGLYGQQMASGASPQTARTVAVNVFVFGELFYLFNCRSLRHSMFHLGVFSNRWLLLGVGSMVLLQIAYTYLPWMNRAFHSAPIAAAEWLYIIGVGVAIYASVGFEKWLRFRRERWPGRSSRVRPLEDCVSP